MPIQQSTMIILSSLVLTLFTNFQSQATPPPQKTDVVVYGATPSGIIAAVAVAREGNQVVLLEPSQHLGGMVSGGLGATDTGNRGAIGGYSREFFVRVREYYKKKYGPQSQQVKDCSDGYRFEPSVAMHVFEEMLKEARVPVLFGQRLATVHKEGKKIVSIKMENGKEFSGEIFIDASYEGDLLARVGVSYTIGREGREKYNESLAGVQKYSPAHQWPVKVLGVDEKGQPLPFVSGEGPGKPGAQDKKVQAYNFRLCLTQRPDLRLPFPKPKNYDPDRFELLARYLSKRPDVSVRQLMNPVKVPNGKTDTNNNGPFSTDYIGKNWDYPDADYETRAKIWLEHEDYTKGFLYFLANDPRVPPKLQKEMQSWGLSKGEFINTDNWPPQLYVREARRMLGVYIMTQTDIMDKRLKEDSVGLGSYNTDSHHVQRVLTKENFVLNEGDFQVRVSPYAIPYRSLLPKKQECNNLLVSVCVSASHVAYGTIRMEPVYMILGQASGVAASLAVEDKCLVHEISVKKLQDKLLEQKAILSPEGLGTSVPKAARIALSSLKGVVVDDKNAQKKGLWLHSVSVGPFVAEGYLHDNNENQGKSSVRFQPDLPKAGRYQVFLYYTPHANRASKVLVVIHSAKGDEKVIVNQREKPSKGALSLGVFEYSARQKGWVEIRNEEANGHVIADAVQFVPDSARKDS